MPNPDSAVAVTRETQAFKKLLSSIRHPNFQEELVKFLQLDLANYAASQVSTVYGIFDFYSALKFHWRESGVNKRSFLLSKLYETYCATDSKLPEPEDRKRQYCICLTMIAAVYGAPCGASWLSAEMRRLDPDGQNTASILESGKAAGIRRKIISQLQVMHGLGLSVAEPVVDPAKKSSAPTAPAVSPLSSVSLPKRQRVVEVKPPQPAVATTPKAKQASFSFKSLPVDIVSELIEKVSGLNEKHKLIKSDQWSGDENSARYFTALFDFSRGLVELRSWLLKTGNDQLSKALNLAYPTADEYKQWYEKTFPSGASAAVITDETIPAFKLRSILDRQGARLDLLLDKLSALVL